MDSSKRLIPPSDQGTARRIVREQINSLLNCHKLTPLSVEDDLFHNHEAFDSLFILELAFYLEENLGLRIQWQTFEMSEFASVQQIASLWLNQSTSMNEAVRRGTPENE
jgi:acyl carrier protein